VVITILTDLTSHTATVEEQKKIWLYELLYFLGIDVEILDEIPGDVAVEYLIKNGVHITDYPSIGALKVEHRRDHSSPLEVVGEWAGPEYSVKMDEEGKLYYEVSIECWSIIDEGIDME
jgi:hypothetical protein